MSPIKLVCRPSRKAVVCQNSAGDSADVIGNGLTSLDGRSGAGIDCRWSTRSRRSNQRPRAAGSGATTVIRTGDL